MWKWFTGTIKVYISDDLKTATTIEIDSLGNVTKTVKKL